MPIILDGTNGLDSPDLNITGTGARITGDFSNATVANRVAFQSSTGTFTSVPVYGPGASQSASIDLILGNDATNTSRFHLLSSTVDARLSAGIYGTGTYVPMTFFTGGSESLRISATSKAVILAGGNTSANGTGITFPATQSASSDANTLDDYEEGTWSPVVEGTSSAGTATYANQNGRYTKIGRMVYFEFYLNWSSGNGSGNLQFGGLPFASGAASTYPSYAIGYWDSIAITSGQIPMCFSGNSSTKINFVAMNAGGTGTGTVNYDGNGAIQISGCYTV
jgi:hypothetical protein